ncbi:MAG: SEL1-like repeat protein [Thiotrichaceae bacterium]|nr:SEL1-like repeat protein [Thiotrichaceae bacterium]
MIKIFLLLIVASFEVIASYDAGRIAFAKGDFTQAHELWLEAAKDKTGLLNDSLQWTRSSYEQQRNAQYAIAVLYWQGKGVKQDYKQAAKWLKLAIKSGHIKAQLNMGYLYLQGKGVKKDEVKARKKFLIAAEHGFVDAQYNIGLMYLKGIGGNQNTSKAKYWLKEAAFQGDGQAFEELMKFKEYDNNELPNKIATAQVLEERVRFQADAKNKLQIESKLVTKELAIEKQTAEPIPVKYDEVKPEQVKTPGLQKPLVLHKPTWLLKQTGNKYALQVLAMRSLRRLKSVTDSLAADGDWAYFVKQKGKSKYFILLRCCFPNKRSANIIRQNFPSEIKNLQPFPIHLKKVLPFVIPDQ